MTVPGKLTVLENTRQLSVYAVLAVVVAFWAIQSITGPISPTIQVWVAITALAIGIPHGALDHIVTVPSMRSMKMVRFVVVYLAVVAVAFMSILFFPLWGFVVVVVMSAVHFGMGDASFTSQAQANEDRGFAPWWIYAIPAGALPVVVPLTSAESSQALELVNPDIVNWDLGFAGMLFWGTLAVSVIAIILLLLGKQHEDARDLVVLGVLVLTTPPLIAFAAYFGLWHALRHTARLSVEIPAASREAHTGKWLHSLWNATLPGLPALAGTMLAAAAVTYFGGWLITDFLWITLALVWALTVPHMAITWRLDMRALHQNNSPANQQGIAETPASIRR